MSLIQKVADYAVELVGKYKREEDFSRRDFLGLATLVGSGAAASGLISNIVGATDAYAQDNISKRLDSTTYWTPEKFMSDIVNSGKVTLVYWRHEKAPLLEQADKFFDKVITTYKDKLIQIIRIDLEKYSKKEMKALFDIQGELNPEEGKLRGVPAYSIIFKGAEYRIRGPPTKENYSVDADKMIQDINRDVMIKL